MRKLLSLLLLTSSLSFASGPSSYDDLKSTLNYMIKGSYLQFSESNNLYYAAAGVPLTWYAFQEDKRMSDLQRSKKLRKIYDITGDLGIVFNFPLIPIGAYYMGKKTGDDKLSRFAMEYAATLYLTLLETGIISYIPGHERPNKEGQSKWETSFRGKNSFPSGHIVPYSALFFKTLQFYGPYYAAAPLVLTYWASLQRMREGRHYVSDILGSFFLTAFASEGVRKASGFKDNHPFYKWLFEHDFDLGVARQGDAIGPRFTFSF